MSTQRGNSKRSRAQKHKNRTAFQNDKHDTSDKTKLINSIEVSDVCARCKVIIEWKIKYKKYRPLRQPKTCTKCDQRSIKQAYHVICSECVQKLKVCAKCLQSAAAPEPPPDQGELTLDPAMKQLLQTLPERRRRTFLRFMNRVNDQKKQKTDSELTASDINKARDSLLNQLKELTLKLSQDDNVNIVMKKSPEDEF